MVGIKGEFFNIIQERYSKMNPVYGILLMISVVSLIGLGTAHAQPFEEVNADIPRL